MKIREAKFIKAIVKPAQAPTPRLPSVAFAGRSNVGKSSLINAITGRKGLARTSGTPGRTQEIIYFDIDRRFYFVDLPGYGYAKAPLEVRKRWGPMIEGFLKGEESIGLVVLILDVRRDPSDQDKEMITWLEHYGIPYIFAITKCDKLKRGAIQKRLSQIKKDLQVESDEALLPFSAVSGMGKRELLKVIETTLSS